MVSCSAAADGLDRRDLGLEMLLSPGAHLRRIHASRIDAPDVGFLLL